MTDGPAERTLDPLPAGLLFFPAMGDNAADMAKGMEFPHAPAPSENAEALEAARTRTREALAKWKSRNVRLHAALVALAGLSTVEQDDRRVGVADASELWTTDIERLDPEMSRERFEALMETVPDGFVERRVFQISYKDERLVNDGEYGLSGLGTLATAADAGSGDAAPTLITFYRDAREAGSRSVWGDVVLHEIAHANDWEGDPTFAPDERRRFRAEVVARLEAPDRFRSGYVERIDHQDERLETDRKAKEYWSEAFSAYLRAEPMSEADEAIVQAVIRRKDPDFDRDAALEKRNAILLEMDNEEFGLPAKPAAPAPLTSVAGWETNPDL